MARAITSESRRLYSWWWDSHISPKNSKWLQENLTEMDTKVKSMIKLIEIDADSFARRAEMYFKKRPELMKLVEEFYRAYRALAERYDYTNGELHHAQKALQAAFPDQDPFTLPEDSSCSTDPDAIKHESFGPQLFGEDECEVERLKIAEKDFLFDQYQLEKKIVVTKEEANMLAEEAVKVEMEVEKLKTELSSAQSDVQRLMTEIVNKDKKLKHVEEMCVRLEASNQCLKMEVSELAKKNMLRDQELSDKHDEFIELKQMKERLEEEGALQSGQCITMQKEIFDLKEEITKLKVSYNSLTLNPESFESSVKNFPEENSSLNDDLQSSPETFHVEKSNLVLQKSVLEKNLSAANNELKNHRGSMQKRLEVLENRFMQFEKEKETGNSRILELVSSTMEKQEHESLMMMNQKRLDNLENKLKEEELQEELDKAVIAQFENFILHKYVKEVEEDNHCLSVEIKKHIEASKLADDLISELEREILEQHVEEELLLVEVENLRLKISQVFLSLGIGSNSKSNAAKISTEEIVNNIKSLKHSLLKEEDDKQRLLIENTIVSTILMDKYETMKNGFLKVKKENLDLVEANENLGLELVMLDEEAEDRENVQDRLSSDSAKLVFDLQVSNIVFESKVHELVEVCESLEGEWVTKDQEIEEMKRKAGVMEREIEGLKAQLVAYTPVIGSLKENISSLEHNVFNVANLIVSNNRRAQDMEVKVDPHHNQRDPAKGISELIELQTRITTLEKVIVEDITNINTVARRKIFTINTKPKPTKPDTEETKSNDHQKRHKEERLRGSKRYLTLDNPNIPKSKPELSEVRDIPLDQASDGGSSSTNSRSRSRRGYMPNDNMLLEQLQMVQKSHKLPYEPQSEDVGLYKLQVSNKESKKGKVLQRLASDAHKLSNLESTVKDLTKRLEGGKRSRIRNPNGVDYKIVKEQLEEAKETILQLANVEKNLSLAAWLEQDDTWKWSERIKTVQINVENIQCVLMKLDDEKKSKGKGRFSMSKSRTSVVLSDFIHRGGRSRRRRLCGCFTPSSTKGDRVKS